MNAPRAALEWVRESPMLATLITVLMLLIGLFVFFGFSDPAWVYCFFGVKTGMEKFRILEFIGVSMGGVLLAIGATIANRRAVAMERTAKAQARAAKAQAAAAKAQAAANRGAEDGRRQERLKNAIEHLGHKSDSVRMGGAYELFHLAQDTEYLCQTVMDILCAHIRWTTSDESYQENESYQEKYKSKPSTEVQRLLSLLFVQEHEVFKECDIHLWGSWLNGAFLGSARLQRADLAGAQLQGANLLQAQLQGANLPDAKLQGVILQEARLQGVEVFGAQLQGANLHEAQLQGTDLSRVHLQGANLDGAKLQGANLYVSQLQQAKGFHEAQLQGVTGQTSKVSSFEERIRKGIGRKTDQSFHKLAKLHGATTGDYTAEEAERWIAEYREATGEV